MSQSMKMSSSWKDVDQHNNDNQVVVCLRLIDLNPELFIVNRLHANQLLLPLKEKLFLEKLCYYFLKFSTF